MEQPTFGGLHADLSNRVIHAFYDVANELGTGFLESVYHKAMLIALRQAGLKAVEEVAIPVVFRGQPAGNFFADIVVNNLIILELKVSEGVNRAAAAQVTNYLKASSIEVGLVLAFGERALFKRTILTNGNKPDNPLHPRHPCWLSQLTEGATVETLADVRNRNAPLECRGAGSPHPYSLYPHRRRCGCRPS